MPVDSVRLRLDGILMTNETVSLLMKRRLERQTHENGQAERCCHHQTNFEKTSRSVGGSSDRMIGRPCTLPRD
jgi:hypothetical protein